MTTLKVLKALLLVLFFTISSVYAQQPVTTVSSVPGDSGRIVRIIRANRLTLIKTDSLTEKYILTGQVQLQQGNTTFFCDSAIKDDKTNIVEAFGNIHINDADSIHTYAQYLKYLGNSRMATLKKRVKLTDGKGVLTTEELQYDVGARIGFYQNGGKLVNGSSVLNSKEGYYYADTREAYFRKDVKLVDPEYTMATDTLLYNIDQELATFVSATTINDGRTLIRTRSGFYNLKTGQAQFGKRPTIEDSSQLVIADNIQYDKKAGAGIAEGNVLYKDTAQGVTMLSGFTAFNSVTGQVTASRKPVMILQQDGDSLYISADTLLSKKNVDSLWQTSDPSGDDSLVVNQPPSLISVDTIRYFQAYNHVRIFSDSLQGVCDSLVYSSRDSVFRFFKDPVLWARDSQVSGDTIFLLTKNKKPDQIYVIDNGFSVNKTPQSLFNQIKGNTLNGVFRDGTIDYLRAKGSAESLYYLQEEDSSYFGLNYAKADAITMYFMNKELKKVTWVNGVEGTTWPFRQIPEDKKLLRNFKWQESRKPKTKYELFSN